MGLYRTKAFATKVDKGVKDLFGSEGEGTTQVGLMHIDLLERRENLKI